MNKVQLEASTQQNSKSQGPLMQKAIVTAQPSSEMENPTWPIYKADPLRANEKFWERKNIKPILKETIRVQGAFLRIGKKKKSAKTYYFKLGIDGMLQYFKKESDTNPKGQLQLTMGMMVHLLDHKSGKDMVLSLRIEKQVGLAITLYELKPQFTLDLCHCLKDYCVVTGFDKLYTQQQLLGKGSFASVYKVQSIHSGRDFAAKTYLIETFEGSQHKNKFVNEIMALRKVCHPGIIQLFEVIQEKNRLILIMELVNGTDLYVLLKEQKKISEKNAAYMLQGVADALNELHKNGFVHRDLKLENIMLKEKDSWDIQLVDFGFAEPINDKELVSRAGTPGYIPPEIFRLSPYTSKGDVFSIGVIFYSLISGLSAFKGKNYQAVLDENRKCDINFERSIWNTISYDCKALIRKMLAVKPQSRISCADILEDDWILDHTCLDQKINSKSFKKQMTKQRSMKGQSDGSDNDFNCEFSYKTNDLKSFYQRQNSQKTFKTQKSNISVHSNNMNGLKFSNNIYEGQRSMSAQKQQQFTQMKSQTLKASVHNKHLNARKKSQEEVSPNNGYASEQGSFGEIINKDSIDEETKNSMKIFKDMSIPIYNITFLKQSSSTFNKVKRFREKAQ